MPSSRILAIKLRSLGDTVLMTAPLTELKRAFPGAEIHAAVLDHWAPVLEHHPAVSKIWQYHRHPDALSRAKAIAKLAMELRKQNYDMVVNFHASPSSSLLAFASGARTRAIHFHGHKDKNRYSTVQIPGKGTLKPIIERDMDTIRALGAKAPEGLLPKIELLPLEIQRADEVLKKLGLATPILGIGLGAGRPTKAWPVERYAMLAVEWVKARGGSAFALAGPEENTQVQRFLGALDDVLGATVSDPEQRASIRSRIAAGSELSVRQLAAILSRISVFAGNDSGPKHVAIAVGTPTVTLFGPEHPFEWHPYPKDRHPYFFIESLICRKDAMEGMPPWCGVDPCVIEKHKCMTMIGVDQVLAECLRVGQRAGRS